MTVAILADAPTLTTGFGVTSRRIADALHGVGWEVACFGLKARPGDCAGHTPYLIWAAERGGHWTDSLGDFFTTTRPRLLLLNMDAYNAVECLGAIRSAGYRGPVASYVVSTVCRSDATILMHSAPAMLLSRVPGPPQPTCAPTVSTSRLWHLRA